MFASKCSMLFTTLIIMLNLCCANSNTVSSKSPTPQITATIDGKPWQSYKNKKSGPSIKWEKLTNSSGAFYSIKADNDSSIETLTLNINTAKILLNKTYYLNSTANNFEFNPTFYKGVFIYYGKYPDDNLKTSGKIIITAFDEKKMSGTFEMKLGTLDYVTNSWHYLTIENGIFTDVGN